MQWLLEIKSALSNSSMTEKLLFDEGVNSFVSMKAESFWLRIRYVIFCRRIYGFIVVEFIFVSIVLPLG